MKAHFYQSAKTGAWARAQQCWSKDQLSGPTPHLLGRANTSVPLHLCMEVLADQVAK